jgi:hypothetical protein
LVFSKNKILFITDKEPTLNNLAIGDLKMSKKLLNEHTIQRFGKLANLNASLTSNFLNGASSNLEEEEEAEMMADDAEEAAGDMDDDLDMMDDEAEEAAGDMDDDLDMMDDEAEEVDALAAPSDADELVASIARDLEALAAMAGAAIEVVDDASAEEDMGLEDLAEQDTEETLEEAAEEVVEEATEESTEETLEEAAEEVVEEATEAAEEVVEEAEESDLVAEITARVQKRIAELLRAKKEAN